MSAKEKIARLEALLARVKSRGVITSPHAQAQANGAPVAVPAARPSEPEVVVEISTEVVEVDIDVDEVAAAAESGSHLVAERDRSDDHEGSAETHRADDLARMGARPVVPANEIEEPAPSSSPRPIGMDKAGAYEEESAPRHTPPPESGKQVAAPSVSPAARRPSAAPAPINEHAIVGGWREPGVPREIAGNATRGSVPAPAPPSTRPSLPAPPRQVSAADRAFAPEITRGEISGSATVASFEGAAPTFAPSTFGELLDASLEL